ncbi:hypothetical protein HPP92_016899 [Vanilla planifolia]|uniref:Uncharacterized protein n=1 Tax=Vanilla planifolia TaxID=51239 RepID=A0A835QPL5_VANPL|nr:hypothetical protein HPP92_017490 [Vanilla planifolia]KAG0472353.1 hypothetical protein HPP92_016899 [Vanilla planifolia]
MGNGKNIWRGSKWLGAKANVYINDKGSEAMCVRAAEAFPKAKVNLLKNPSSSTTGATLVALWWGFFLYSSYSSYDSIAEFIEFQARMLDIFCIGPLAIAELLGSVKTRLAKQRQPKGSLGRPLGNFEEVR